MNLIKLARPPIYKTSAQTVIVDVDFADDLGASETISSVDSVTYSPAGVTGSGTVVSTAVQIPFAAGTAPITITAEDTSANTFTAVAHGLANGTRVHVVERKDPAATSCLPAGISESKQYWVVGADTNTFQLAECEGGDAVDITAAATGAYKVAIDTICTIQATTSAGQSLYGQAEIRVRE